MNGSAEVLAWHCSQLKGKKLEQIMAHYENYPKIWEWTEWEKQTKKPE